MMLKVGSEYLDFNDSVELERKAKLFENLDSSDGDFSFQFEVPETSHNSRILHPFPDSISKEVYHRIDADLQDDSGVSLHFGFLRVERRVSRESIALSFFSGNSNWFGLISGNLMDMDMSAYDIEQTQANIISSWANTTGLTFPLIDHGGLLFRGFPHVKIEDFVAGFYVSTVFKKIFTDSQIKLTGELFEEPLYQKLITVKNSKDQESINTRSANIRKTPDQVIANFTVTKVLYDDDSTYPYFDGDANLWDLANSRFVADIKMNVRVESTMSLHTTGGPIGVWYTEIWVNGVVNRYHAVGTLEDGIVSNSMNYIIGLEAGDILEIYTEQTNLDGDAATILDGTLKITPTFIYKTFGTAALPNWTKQQYVSSIFQLFNVITSFDPKTKTLTCNLFDKIKEKPPIDISQYVQVDEVDYTEFISSYGKSSTFSYQELDFDDLKEYNIANFFKYGTGAIEVDNDFLPENESIIESDFSNPFSYINPVFQMSMERTNLIELDEGEQVTFSDVADDGAGYAAFNISNEIFIVGDLVRITNSTNAAYNGDFIVRSIPSGHIVTDLPFDTAASGDINKLDYTYANADDVFIFVNIPTYPVSSFSGAPIQFDEDVQTEMGLAYFSLLNTDRQINTDYKQSLSFGEIQDPLFYQRTLIETFWSLVTRVLNDPVKPICTGFMPSNVYRSIDFLRPVMIKTLETSNLYYVNLLSGYKSSYEPFTIELIKLP